MKNKKYQIVYADCPWSYGGSGGSKWSNASEYYDVMSKQELIDFGDKLKDYIDNDNCLLFGWVVNPYLKQCIEVYESWGFKYITVGFVWDKRRANVGNYTMSGTEQCLIFKRGKIPFDRVRNPGTLQLYSESIQKHSAKPDEFRKRIEQMYPISNKLELFARNKLRDWDVFGNQVENSIILK